MYSNPFQITENISNNYFSFDKRKDPSIFVTDIQNGGVDDVRIGDKIVFEDFDEKGELKSCVGLKHFIRLNHPTTEKPIIVVDNHNHVFYFWHEARNKGIIRNGATLIHIDQHKDMREPSSFLTESDAQDLKKVFEYTNSVLNVGNYILPAVRDGLIENVIQITGEKELSSECAIRRGGRLQMTESIILNIDLDFWAPEMDYIDYDLKIRRTKEWMARADLITIATSPFFVGQDKAINVLHKLLKF